MRRTDLITDKEIKTQATELLSSIATSARGGKISDVSDRSGRRRGKCCAT